MPMVATPIPRVQATEAAQALIEQLRGQHGELLFYQSLGCCAGSAPMCFTVSELKLNATTPTAFI